MNRWATKPIGAPHNSELMRAHSIAGAEAFKRTTERRSETFDWDDAIKRFKKMMRELGYRGSR